MRPFSTSKWDQREQLKIQLQILEEIYMLKKLQVSQSNSRNTNHQAFNHKTGTARLPPPALVSRSRTPYLTANTRKGSGKIQYFNLSLGNLKYAGNWR